MVLRERSIVRGQLRLEILDDADGTEARTYILYKERKLNYVCLLYFSSRITRASSTSVCLTRAARRFWGNPLRRCINSWKTEKLVTRQPYKPLSSSRAYLRSRYVCFSFSLSIHLSIYMYMERERENMAFRFLDC